MENKLRQIDLTITNIRSVQDADELHPACVEIHSELMTHLIRAENANLKKLVRLKLQQNPFVCPLCSKVDDGRCEMVQCDASLHSYHFTCASYRQSEKDWFCRVLE